MGPRSVPSACQRGRILSPVRPLFTLTRGMSLPGTRPARGSRKVAPSAVGGVHRDPLAEAPAEGLRPLPGPLLGDAHLPLLDALVGVGPVPEVGELPAGLGAYHGLHRRLDGLPVPVG